MEMTFYCVVLMVYIRVDLLLSCLANIILHFLVLLEEYNSSNRLNYNSNRIEIMHLYIIRYYPIVYIVLIITSLEEIVYFYVGKYPPLE